MENFQNFNRRETDPGDRNSGYRSQGKFHNNKYTK